MIYDGIIDHWAYIIFRILLLKMFSVFTDVKSGGNFWDSQHARRCLFPLYHQYATRLAFKKSYYLQKARTNYGKFNICFSGAKLWNAI